MDKIIHLKSTSSTNAYAAKLLKELDVKDGTIIITDEQTSGRGHNKNKWESKLGKNLTFSLIYYPNFLAITKQFYLSKCISLGILDYLKKHTNKIKIKWPNDIYVKDKKIAGILIENTIKGNYLSNSIIGIGLNINQEKFYSDAPNPVSLFQINNKTYDLKTELTKIAICIDKYYDKLKAGNYSELNKQYFKSLYRKGKFYKYQSEEGIFKGKIVGISEFGHLQIQTKNQILKEFDFKEIKFLDI